MDRQEEIERGSQVDRQGERQTESEERETDRERKRERERERGEGGGGGTWKLFQAFENVWQ